MSSAGAAFARECGAGLLPGSPPVPLSVSGGAPAGEDADDAKIVRAVAIVEAGLRGTTSSQVAPVFNTSSSARAFLLRRRLLRARQAALALYIVVGFLEPPPFCGHERGLCPGGSPAAELHAWPPRALPVWAALAADLVLLAALLGDCVLALMSRGEQLGARSWQSPLAIVTTALAACSWCEVLARLVGAPRLPARVQPYRLLRPVLWACMSFQARRGFELVVGAVWATRLLFFRVGMFLLISAWVAVILFADCNEAFQSYSSTLLNLFILLTTSNYPDVQTPLVNDYWLAFLFFFGFLVTGLFLLMNLIFSAIYAQYLTIFRASLARDHRRREDTVMHAFALLAVPPTAQAPAEVSQRSVSWEAAPEAEDGFVTEEVWCDFFCAWARLSRALVREQCPRVRGRAIFQSVQSESHTPEGLDSGEFCALVLTLSDSDVVTRTQQNVQPLAGPKRAAAARLLRRPLVQHTISALLLLNLAALAVDTSRVVQQGVPPRTAFSLRERLTRPSLLINPCFTVLWDGELSARVWALGGLKYCWRGGGGTLLLRAELVILATTTAAEFVAFAAPASGMLWKACTLLRVARALRFWGRQKSFQMFAQSVVRILPAASMVLNAMIAVHLFYAEIGLQLFGGVLRESNGALDGTVWQKSSYWSNNFNSLASSVMVLFEQLVVNNWFVVMDAEAAVGGMWSRAYFISHYIIGVLAVANVFVAFVVEAWRQQMTQLSEGPSAGTAAQGRLRANTSGDLSGGGSQRCRFQSEAEWMRPQATLVREMFATDIQQILAENVATNSPRLAAARLRPGDYIQRTGNLEAALRANSPTRATSWRS